MSLWSVIIRRALGNVSNKEEVTSRLCANEIERLAEIALQDEPVELERTLELLNEVEIKELAREVLRERAREALEVLRNCASCRKLLSSGGYDPVRLLETLRENIGRSEAQMDIDESGCGGSQRGQGFETCIRFGPREFLLGRSLDGMTVRESQIQVILHELGHAAGDVIPPDGNNAAESVRNQHRITRTCLPETYERINRSFQF